MTIIKNHFEVFILTSKKQGNGIIESKIGLYSIKTSSHIFVNSIFRETSTTNNKTQSST
jgi:hypothetical protein